jgi:Tfp pilus assembly protein PilX
MMNTWNPVMPNSHLHRERGAVLIVSLLILLVLSIIGVSSLSNSNLEERMSSNFQHSMLAFQAAESAIADVIHQGDPGGGGTNSNPFYDVDSDPLVAALDAGLDDTSTTVAKDMDPDDNLHNANLDTTSTISYKGVRQLCPGFGVGINCLRFQISTAVTIDASNTNSTHIQGIERPAPGV